MWTAAIAIALVFMMYAPVSTQGLVLGPNSRGYFDDKRNQALENRDFSYGVQGWVVEQGSASRSDNCLFSSFNRYRSNPTMPYSLCVRNYNAPVWVRQDIKPTTIEQIKGNWIVFSFWFRSPDDAAQAQLGYKTRWWDNSCYCYREQWYTPWGNGKRASTQPGDLAWTNVFVQAYIPVNTVSMWVRMIIADASATRWVGSYVDDADLSVFDYRTTSNPYGRMSLAVNLWEVDDDQFNPSTHRRAFFSVAVSGNSNPGYAIMWTKIRIEMEPNAPCQWWEFCDRKTSQSGRVFIEDVAQSNNRNLAVNPRDQQEAKETAAIATGIAVGVAAGLVAGPLGGVIANLAIDVGTVLLLEFIGEYSNQFDILADGGTNYFTNIQWWYPDVEDDTKLFVTLAGGSNNVVWTFLAGQDSYRVKVIAEVGWGEPVKNRYGYYLSGIGATSVSLIIDP